MMKSVLKIVLSLFLVAACTVKAYKVGLLVVATGRYIEFVPPLLESARTHFCKNHEVTYFIFTDALDVDLGSDVVVCKHARVQWPYATLLRCQAYAVYQDAWRDMDYVFACDADMLFAGTVGDEILSDRVATIHPGFVGRRGTYEEVNQQSTAYVAPHEGEYYFAGGFHGGSNLGFTHLITTMLSAIKADLANSFIAVWHDESYLNRYFIDYKPTCILTPSYCYPEGWNPPYEKKLIARYKDHNAYREWVS